MKTGNTVIPPLVSEESSTSESPVPIVPRGIFTLFNNSLQNSQSFPCDASVSRFLNKNYPSFLTEYDNLLKYSTKRRSQICFNTLQWLCNRGYLSNTCLNNYIFDDSIHNYIEFGEKNIHRKGVSGFNNLNHIVACPLSMTRGTLFVKQIYSDLMNSCSHGAGRRLSRADSLNYWYTGMKNKDRKKYIDLFPEYYINGEFNKSIITELDFCYKDHKEFFKQQYHLKQIDHSIPIVTIKLVL